MLKVDFKNPLGLFGVEATRRLEHASQQLLPPHALMQRAGIAIARSGGRTLRNTFAVQELKNGATDDELTEHLGLALESSTKTYAIAGSKLAGSALAKSTVK